MVERLLEPFVVLVKTEIMSRPVAFQSVSARRTAPASSW